MKVGCIGAGGTGKTTMMHMLCDRLGMKPIPSVVREVFKEFGAVEADQNGWPIGKRWELQRKIFERKLQQEAECRDGIADRTLLDHLMYSYIRCAEAIGDGEAKKLECAVINSLQRYDCLFFFPVGHFEPPGDGMRDGGLAYRLLQDTVLRGLMTRMDVGRVTVPAGTPEARADFMEREIMWRMENQ